MKERYKKRLWVHPCGRALGISTKLMRLGDGKRAGRTLAMLGDGERAIMQTDTVHLRDRLLSLSRRTKSDETIAG